MHLSVTPNFKKHPFEQLKTKFPTLSLFLLLSAPAVSVAGQKTKTEREIATMAGAVAGVGVGFGLSCSTTKLSHRHSSSSSSSSSSTKTTRRCCVKMAVSLDEKKTNYTLQKSEEAFAVAKVFLFFFIPISIHSKFLLFYTWNCFGFCSVNFDFSEGIMIV